MDQTQLISEVCPPLDPQLFEALVVEFVSMERRFILGDWEPATLDGGQFAEIASRIVYHIDSGTLNKTKGVDPCLKWIEDADNQHTHNFPKRRSALHLCRVLRTIYKFRSQRGAVHIDPDYTANELDSTMLMGNVRWLFAEILRIFWSGSTSDVAAATREIVRFHVPAVIEIDDKHLVLRTDCSAEEEILILLHNAGESGMTRTQLGKSIPRPAPRITDALTRIIAPSKREVAKRANGTLVLTPNGSKRVFEELAPKLSLG